MLDISPDWLVAQFPELALMQDPQAPSDVALDFFLAQQNDARLGFLSTGSGASERFDAAAAKRFWPALRAEFHDFLCTDSKRYADLRKQLKSIGGKSEATVLSAITAAIAATLGAATAALVPLVVLCLYAVARIGAAAYCRISGDGAGP